VAYLFNIISVGCDIMQFGRLLPRFGTDVLPLSSKCIIPIALPDIACMDLAGIDPHGSFATHESCTSLLLPVLSALSSPWGYGRQTFSDTKSVFFLKLSRRKEKQSIIRPEIVFCSSVLLRLETPVLFVQWQSAGA
jgi:hypothetical protein